MAKFSPKDIEILKREIDHWEGKFSMDAFKDHIVKVLNLDKLNKGTIYNLAKDYPEIKDRIEAARERYRNEKAAGPARETDDQLLNEARSQIKMLKAEVASLKSENSKLQETIIQMLYNAYYEKINIEGLSRPVDTKEAKNKLSEKGVADKVAFFNRSLPPSGV